MPPTVIQLDNQFTHSKPEWNVRYSDRPEYREGGTREGMEIHRRMQCNWRDVPVFPSALLGDVSSAGNGRLRRVLPHQHPYTKRKLFACDYNLVNANGAWSKGADGIPYFSDQINNLDGLAEWEVIYRQLQYDVLPDHNPGKQEGIDQAQAGSIFNTELYRFVSRMPKYSLENYQMPGLGFRWQNPKKRRDVVAQFRLRTPGAGPLAPFANFVLGRDATLEEIPGTRRIIESDDGPQNIPESVVKRRPLVEVRYTWHWVPEPIPKAWLAYEGGGGEVVVGRLNNFKFDTGNPLFPKGFEAGFVLCGEPQISERFYTPSGMPARDLTAPLYFRPDATWNKFWRQSVGRFEQLVPIDLPNGQTAEPLYKPGDFDKLFTHE